MWDASKKAIVVDPGMSNRHEQELFSSFVEANGLSLQCIFLTHAHIDHVMGNQYVIDQYGLETFAHKDSVQVLDMATPAAKMYGIPFETPPPIDHFLDMESPFKVGDYELEMRFAPGHAPGHVVLIDHPGKQIVAGDVLFDGSVGRVDLPGGDGPLLAKSIVEQLYTLPDDYAVYCGHGGETTIGKEKRSNPFVSIHGTRL